MSSVFAMPMGFEECSLAEALDSAASNDSTASSTTGNLCDDEMDAVLSMLVKSLVEDDDMPALLDEDVPEGRGWYAVPQAAKTNAASAGASPVKKVRRGCRGRGGKKKSPSAQ